MAEHYTKRTVEVSAYCARCKRQTRHRVAGHRKGGCLECYPDKQPPALPPADSTEIRVACRCSQTAVRGPGNIPLPHYHTHDSRVAAARSFNNALKSTSDFKAEWPQESW